MSLPAAIVFSSLLLALVILYGFTKDRWPWKRIAFWTVGGLVLLLAAGAVGVWWLTQADTAGEREVEERSRHKVEIGDDYRRVLQRQGVPDTTVALDSGAFAIGYWDDWNSESGIEKVFGFSDDSSLTFIRFLGDRYTTIEQEWTPADGVVLGATRDSVVARLGPPCREEVDDTYTILSFTTERPNVTRDVRVSHGEGRVILHGWYRGECDQ